MIIFLFTKNHNDQESQHSFINLGLTALALKHIFCNGIFPNR